MTTAEGTAPAGASTGTDAPAGADPAPTPGAATVAPGAPARAGRPGARTVDLASLHPARRDDLLLSGPLQRGEAVVHLVRDPVAGRTYELGPKEHFVLAALDGERTLGEIGDAYAATFRTRLGDAHWTKLLGLLGTRRLLAGAPLETPPPPAEKPNTVLDGRIRLAADAPRLHRLLAPLLRPVPLGLLTALVLAMLGVVAGDAGELADATAAAFRQPVTLVALVLALQLSTALHELAHGLAARAFGGTVTEFGLRWRLPAVYPYCAVEDVRFLPARWQQVTVAAAGAYANLVFLVPFALAWLLAPADALGALLVLGVAVAALNLLPLPPLDGYKVVSYALGVDRLALSSRRWLALAVRGKAGGHPRGALFAAYGTFVIAVAAAAVAAFVLVGFRLLDRWGTAAGLAPAGLLVALLALWAAGNVAKKRSEVTA